MESYGELSCAITIETLNKQGTVSRKNSYNKGHAVLGRDQFKDLTLKIGSEKYRLKDIKILHKFIREGKATLILTNLNINILFYNAPPDKLAIFMKLVKVKSSTQKSFASDRVKLYSTKPNSFEDISPLTVQDVSTYKKDAVIMSPIQANATKKNAATTNVDITPIRGTKRGLEVVREGSRKKFNSTPMALIKLGKENKPVNQSNIGKSSGEGDVKAPTKKVNLGGKLTEGQIRVLNTVKQGFNLFFTGSAGTGKSYILKRIIGSLPPDTTVASASTGVAACQIGGVTLHSFAGIGRGDGTLEECIQLASRTTVAQNWKRCKVLIIDEISMIDCEFFNKLEEIARVVRNDDRPFGGIQLILCGDFLQLPPVQKERVKKRFCFQSDRWKECVQVSLELTDVKRQNDQSFISILQYIRVGKCPEHIYKRLMDTQKNSFEKFGIQPTRLCTHKDNAEEINNMKMKELKGEARTYVASDNRPEYTEQMNKYLLVPNKLTLKVGAQVMLAKNLDVSKGLVNGARGVVKSIDTSKNGLPVVQFADGLTIPIKREAFHYKTIGGLSTRMQIPLKPAWAISIHKSQGLTLDCCEVSLSRVFEHGQAYVALSRAKSLEGLRVLDMTPDCVKADTDVLKFYIRLRRELRMSSFDNDDDR